MALLPKHFHLKHGGQLTLSLATSEDAEAIIQFLNRAGGESNFLTFGANEFWQSVEAQKRALENAQKDQVELYLKAMVQKETGESELAGMLTLFRSRRPRLLPIGDLAVSVSAHYWNQGIGTALLENAIVWARQSGVKKINLRVRVDNHSAIALYKKLGFVEEGTTSRAIFVNGQFFSEKFMGLEVD